MEDEKKVHVPPITQEDINRSVHAEFTRVRRRMYLQRLGGDEVVHQLEDIIQHLDHSKTIRQTIQTPDGQKSADFLFDRARQLLIEVLGIHLEDA
jgi:hypothetical protein